MTREPVTPQSADALHHYADAERKRSPELADVLDDLADNGLPNEDETTPAGEVFATAYARLGVEPPQGSLARQR